MLYVCLSGPTRIRMPQLQRSFCLPCLNEAYTEDCSFPKISATRPSWGKSFVLLRSASSSTFVSVGRAAGHLFALQHDSVVKWLSRSRVVRVSFPELLNFFSRDRDRMLQHKPGHILVAGRCS
jgi:hypothetical protein